MYGVLASMVMFLVFMLLVVRPGRNIFVTFGELVRYIFRQLFSKTNKSE